MRHLKEIMKAMFDRPCETRLYTLNHHLLDHLVRDLEKFENLEALDTSPTE